MTLELNGALPRELGEDLSRGTWPKDPACIHGSTQGGEPVTVYKSWYQKCQHVSLFSSEVSAATLVSHFALIGGHFKPQDEQLFSSCTIRVPDLNKWIGYSASSTHEEIEDGVPCFVTKTKQLPDQVFATAIGDVHFKSGLSFLGGHSAPFTIQHDRVICLGPREGQKVDWYLKQLQHIERLFALLFGWPVQAEEVRLYSLPERRGEPDSDDLGALMGARLFVTRKRVTAKQPRDPQYLVRYKLVEEQLAAVVVGWFSDYADIDDALNVYFTTIYQPGSFLEHRFLPTVQSLEVLGREMFSDMYVQKEVFKEIEQRLLQALPHQMDRGLRNSITNRLKYANEPTLKTRLRQMLDRLEEQTRLLVCTDSKKFATGIVNTRNYLTHYSEPDNTVLDSTEMHWATQKMRLLMTALLLKRAGLSEEVIRTAFGNHYGTTAERNVWMKVSEAGTRVID